MAIVESLFRQQAMPHETLDMTRYKNCNDNALICTALNNH